jgi:hypothetical protein
MTATPVIATSATLVDDDLIRFIRHPPFRYRFGFSLRTVMNGRPSIDIPTVPEHSSGAAEKPKRGALIEGRNDERSLWRTSTSDRIGKRGNFMYGALDSPIPDNPGVQPRETLTKHEAIRRLKRRPKRPSWQRIQDSTTVSALPLWCKIAGSPG